MDVIKELQQIEVIRVKTDILQEELQGIKKQIDILINLDLKDKGGKLHDLMQRVSEEITELLEERAKRVNIIKEVEDNTQRKILYKFYVKNLSALEIGEALGYSERRICQLKKDTLEELKERYKDVALLN